VFRWDEVTTLVNAIPILIQVIHFEKGLVSHCFKPIDNPIINVNGFVELDYAPAQVMSPHINLLAY
jgi:hypothetical protein